VETVWKFGYHDSQCEAILDVSRRDNPCPVPRVSQVLYNLTAVKIPEGVTMSNLENALRELREKRSQAQIEIEKLDQIISGIESLNGTGAAPSKSIQPKRIISAASRRKMALAQKARWASIRKGSQPVVAAAKTTGSARAKRTMSASARRKIAAAQRARWAKFRAAKKAA
jgi:hypothetical protein